MTKNKENNLFENLNIYFYGINKLSVLESNLVRSSNHLNELVARLYAYGETSKLRILHELMLYGFMQHSTYELYKLSYSRMRDEYDHIIDMGSNFSAYSHQEVLNIGFSSMDLEAIKGFNGSMSALIEKLMRYEQQYEPLYQQIETITKNYTSEEMASFTSRIESRFPNCSGAIYLNALSKSFSEKETKFNLADFVDVHGFIPISYKRYLTKVNI